MPIRLTLLVIIFTSSLLIPKNAHSTIAIGSGYSGALEGRTKPILYLGLGTEQVYFSAASVGVKTSLYYHSAWHAHLYKMFKIDQFWWGPVDMGIGWGAYFAQKGYKTSTTATLDKSVDFITGPALKISWEVAAPFFLALESIYGIADNPIQHVLLSFRTQGIAILGVRF